MALKKVIPKDTRELKETIALTKKPHEKILGKVAYIKSYQPIPELKARDILVWFPPSYSLDVLKRFPVLYMHDGQNLMDPKTAYTGMDWRVDEMTLRLIKEKKIHEFIVVGINNTSDRLAEYSDSTTGELYRKLLTDHLKPKIDTDYRTLPEPENTAVMGSSMGGLCSLILAWKHTSIFGKAACLSSSFYYNADRAFRMVERLRGEKKACSIYIDSGEDGKRDAQKMFVLLSEKGYHIGEDLDYFYERGALHTESAWAKRLERPLIFLFGKKN